MYNEWSETVSAKPEDFVQFAADYSHIPLDADDLSNLNSEIDQAYNIYYNACAFVLGVKTVLLR